MSASKRKPGRKRGAHIHHRLAVRPFGIKSTQTYELGVFSALTALESGLATQGHLVNLYVLADLRDRIGGDDSTAQHAASIKRLCDQIHDAGYRSNEFDYAAMRASSTVLLNWLAVQRNTSIAYHAMQAVQELA